MTSLRLIPEVGNEFGLRIMNEKHKNLELPMCDVIYEWTKINIFMEFQNLNKYILR